MPAKSKKNCFSTNNYPNLFVQQWSVCSTGYYHSDCIQLAATQMIIKYQIDRDYSHFPRIDTHLKLIFVKILLQFVKEKTAKFMRHKNNQKTSWDCNNDRHLYRSQPQPPKFRVIQQQGSGVLHLRNSAMTATRAVVARMTSTLSSWSTSALLTLASLLLAVTSPRRL